MFYHDIVLFLHFIGLALGMGVGVTNLVIARSAASSPETAGPVRALMPMLARISTAGLGILVVTGLLLIFQRGFSFLSAWFWIKMLSVAGMIAVSYLMFQAQAQIRQGNAAAAAQMKMLGPAMGGLGLLTVLFSVFAFH